MAIAPTVQYTEQDLSSRWYEFFTETGVREEAILAADRFPEDRSVFVPFSSVDHFDPDLAIFILQEPIRSLEAAESVLNSMLPPERQQIRLNFRISGLPSDSRIEIRKIRSKHLGTFISVEGLVRKATEVRPRLVEAVFRCARCDAELREKQDSVLLKEPLECSREAGGCGRAAGSTKFILLPDVSTYEDTQKIEIQEAPEGLRGGAQPERLEAYLADDITGRVSPGDRIILNGILTGSQRAGLQGGKSTLFNITLQVNSLEFREHEYDEVQIDREDEERIREIASRTDVIKEISHSISPTIYGLETEKEALALQLFGGVSKEMLDGTKIRGDIHILLVGDPGLAKTQLLRYMSEMAPRGIYASGKSSSAAGLTAAAVKDEFGEGRWTLEAGALVLADKGLACVDEIDKMSENDRSAMHQIMESQIITVAKAGITATLQARCSILGASNPKYGRFDNFKQIVEQIDLAVTLLSRFDLIFVLRDKLDIVMDRNIATHILRAHRVGESMKSEELPSGIDRNSLEADSREVRPEFDRAFMRKYISYARRINPVMTNEAMTLIEEEYVRIRRRGEGTNAMPITARQLEGYIRLSEASARGRLSSTVERVDAERSIRIVGYYLNKMIGDSQGVYDVDRLYSEISSSQRPAMYRILDFIREKSREKGYAERKEIEEFCASERVENFADLLEKLHRNGDIMELKADRFRVTQQ